jgi:uncharacterized protein YcfJ
MLLGGGGIMQRTILITAGIIAAFLGGVVFEGYTPLGVTKAYNVEPAQVAPAPVTHYATRRVVSAPQESIYRETRPAHRRSWEHEALIVAGSSGAGAAIGAAAGGGKGAGIGAVSGAVAGLVYDIATRNK